MSEIQHDVSLKPYNTFGIDQKAATFITIQEEEGLRKYKEYFEGPFLILGGGSNVLLKNDFEGAVFNIAIKGIKVLEETDSEVKVEVGGGENWHDFVLEMLKRGYYGLENLSLIPGTVGASPVQNIGAYGVELDQLFYSAMAFRIDEGQLVKFRKEDCSFEYRNSIFKQELKGKVIITRVTFLLKKNPHLHLDYGAIREELKVAKIEAPTPKDVSDAVIKIRSSKLPDPAELGNSGSFFKNPIVSEEKYKQLKADFPGLIAFELPDKRYKLAAGWLIDHAGLKGYREGDAGVHKKQALVLVNYGDASGEDIYNLARKVRKTVLEMYGVALETEVNVIQ